MRQEKQKEERLRLVSIELRSYPDGTTLAITPSGRLYQIHTDPASVHDLLEKCDGTRTISEVLADYKDAAAFSEIITLLMQDGCLRTGPAVPDEQDWIRFSNEGIDPRKIARANLVLLGDDELLSTLLSLHLTERFASVEIATLETLITICAKYEPSNLVILVLQESDNHDVLIQINNFCEIHRIRWSQLHISQGRGWLGPSVVPGKTANYADLLGRRLTAAEQVETFQASISQPLYGKTHLPSRAEVIWMLTFFLVDIERWLVDAPASTPCHEIELDPITLTSTAHTLLPLPDRVLQNDETRYCIENCEQVLVDERTGPIITLQRLEHHPSIPAKLVTVTAQVAAMKRLYAWSNDIFCGGSSFESYDEAKKAAIGESMERYCANWIPAEQLKKSSYHKLKSEGQYAIDPLDLVLYSQSQYQAEGFPFVPFTRDLEVYWVRGWSLTSNTAAWMPASLVYVNWYAGAHKDEPATNNLYYPGVAAGSTLDAALVSAIEEIIERDATMIWWTNHHPLPALKLPLQLMALWEGAPKEMGQRAWIIPLENEFRVPVMAGVVENLDEQLLTIGFAARPDPIKAGLKAWTEALTLQDGSRDLQRPNGLFKQAAVCAQVNDSAIKPYRADRAYLNEYQPNFHDVTDLKCQQQVFLDPRAREYIRAWVDVEESKQLKDVYWLANRSLETYQNLVERRGYEIFYVDVTTPDILLSGIRVVRVIIPGLVANFPAAFPFLGRSKIQLAALALGWRTTLLAEEELNYFPLPHT
ncbi:MAG: YcaO-like family protein [Ktedonobacteraceae bacterium]|nr:YcaO-like family protein [Ktedonobacteraceae bacterium]